MKKHMLKYLSSIHLYSPRLDRAGSDSPLGLKPEQAECVVLRFLQGLSLAETAKVLGKTEGAVKQLQLRAVRALHRELADVDL